MTTTPESATGRRQYLRFVLAMVALVGLSHATSANAATISPNTFADDNAINGNCTLREAVIAANANAAQDGCGAGSGADTIELAAGTYVLSVPGSGEQAAATGDLDINEDLAVVGQGSAQTTVDGGALDAVFHNDAVGGPVGAASTISDVTIRNGANASAFEGGAITNSTLGRLTLTRSTVTDSVATAAFTGGGIHNLGEARLTIHQSTISGNEVTGAGSPFSGGGILNLNAGEVTITESTIDDNTAGSSFSGGGIANLNEGVLAIERSTISNNNATASSDNTSGGGIMNLNDGQLTIRNSTVSGNTAAVSGGGILNQNEATLSVRSSTVARNSAGTSGGGLFDGTTPSAPPVPPLLSVQGSIVAENTAAGAPQNCAIGATSPGIRSAGHNLEDLDTCGFGAVGDLQNAPAGLGPLTSNGGPTQTHLPGLANAAIDTGIADGLTADQRGLARTADLSETANGAGDGTDIGAVELQAAVCRGQNVPRIDGTGGDDTLTGTERADAIFALAGSDAASAGGGNDCVEGNEGNDSLHGGAGKDDLSGDEDKDKVAGDAGKDTVSGDQGKDKVSGGGGKDRLSGGGGKDKLKGGPGKDKIKPGGGKDKINCGGGKDTVTASRNDKVSQNCEKVV